MLNSENNTGVNMALMQTLTEFYEQVVEIKHWLLNDELEQRATTKLKLNHTASDEQIAGAVQQWLLERIALLKRRYQAAFDDESLPAFKLTIYAATALADELLLIELDWPGRDYWSELMLEQKVFNSCEAGDRLFEHIDAVLTRRAFKPQQSALAAIYLLILRIGFKGRNRDEPQIQQQYLEKLTALLTHEQGDSEPPICHQAYQHTLNTQVPQRLAPLTPWYRWAAWGIALYLLVGSIAYATIELGGLV